MRVVIASDHRGFELKAALAAHIRRLGHGVSDGGVHTPEPADYPDVAEWVGRAIQRDEADRGVLICGSGIGASVAANKLHGIRASVCHDLYSARQGVEHDDMNVLVLGAGVIGSFLAELLVETFLSAQFTGEDRYRRRLEKLKALERRPDVSDER